MCFLDPLGDVGPQDHLEGYRIYTGWFEGQGPDDELILVILRYVAVFRILFHWGAVMEVLDRRLSQFCNPNKATILLYDNALDL